MKRWNLTHNDERRNKRVDVFLKAVCEVCKQHGLSISHEDQRGAFVIEEMDEDNLEWLNAAYDGTATTQNVRKK